jgi:glycosyltransferase involved in cell wall biosynthesis
MGLISIVIPVASRVNRQVLQCKQLEKLAADIHDSDFEFIFVDDGSHQESITRLKECAKTDKRYRLIVLTRDFGTTAAFLAGITYASGDCAGFFSGRNLDPSKVFGELIHHWESGAKIVLGKWKNPDSRSRNSRGIAISDPLMRRRIFPNRIYFQDISSLLVDKEVIYILSQISDPFSDIIEILAWTGIDSHLVEYDLQSLQDDGKQLVFQHQCISLEYSEGIYSPKSFRTSLSIGFVAAVFGVLTTAGLIIASDFYQAFIPDWWMMVGVLFFIIGLQLILMGMFGEQIYRSLEKIRNRPVFIVDTIINPPVSSSVQGREKIEKMILSLWNIRKQKVSYASSLSNLPPEDEHQE